EPVQLVEVVLDVLGDVEVHTVSSSPSADLTLGRHLQAALASARSRSATSKTGSLRSWKWTSARDCNDWPSDWREKARACSRRGGSRAARAWKPGPSRSRAGQGART